MSPLRREAIQLVESVPEDNLLALIQILQAEQKKRLAEKVRRAEEQQSEKKSSSLEHLLTLCKPVPDLDYKKALAQYREEKFGNANLS